MDMQKRSSSSSPNGAPSQEFNEGDIVTHSNATFRVRRNYGENLELVNGTGYQMVETNQVEETYYCGQCRCLMPISHFPH